MVIQAIEPSTSITTGALQVAGGAGIVGNVYTGGNVVIQAIEPSTNITTGALQVAGGAGIVGNVYTGGNVVIQAIESSTSTTTGALQVAGGAGIQGNLNIGLDSFFNGNVQLTQTNNPLWFVSNNASTINSTLASGSDVGIFYGPTNPAAAGLVISPRGSSTTGGIKMSISGNVGINTPTPRFTFDVNGIIGIQNDNDNKKLVLYDNAPTDDPNTATNFYGFGINAGMLRYQVDTDAATHAFYGGSTEYMRITAGNMGIGTTTPQARLDVTSTGQNTVTIEVDDVSNTNVMRLIGNLGAAGFNAISQSNDVGIIYGRSSGSSGSIVIAPWETGHPPSGIRMNRFGNVGIGTINALSELDVSGTLRLNAPITQTYTVLPTFTNNQVGNILANVYLISQNTQLNIYPFNILYNIPPGIWMANYTVHIATAASAVVGNITFGMSTVAPAFTGTTMNVFPLNLNSSYGVQKLPVAAAASSVAAASGPIILSGTAVIPFSASGTISIVGNISGFNVAGNAVARSVLTATRIA